MPFKLDNQLDFSEHLIKVIFVWEPDEDGCLCCISEQEFNEHHRLSSCRDTIVSTHDQLLDTLQQKDLVWLLH